MKSKFYYLAAIVVASLSSCVDPNASSGKSGSGGAGAFGPLIFFPLIILVFWLFFIRPQAKKAKQTKDFHQKLQKGDKIVTIAGIHGVIYKINDDSTMLVETSPGHYIKMEKTSVHIDWTQALNKPAPSTEKK